MINGINNKIQRKRLKIKKGSIVVFRGDLIHAGSAYKKHNMRIHCFLDSKFIKVIPNSTQLIDSQLKEDWTNNVLNK